MRSAQFAVALDIPLLQQIRQPLIAIFHFLILRNALENLTVLLIGRITNLDLMPQAAQEGFIHQVFRRQVCGEHNQNVKWDFHFASVVEGQEIYTVFERDDPAVEQITRAYLLASKVINQQDAAVGFYLERRLIKL